MQRVFQEAKEKMREDGNLKQWTDAYPSDALLRQDIERGASYVIEHEGAIVATFALIIGEDPTYRVIRGQWMEADSAYGTIHRAASLKSVHHMMEQILEFAFSQIRNIRIDTHEDNSRMRHILDREGFTYCGIIQTHNGDDRFAYQKIIHKP